MTLQRFLFTRCRQKRNSRKPRKAPVPRQFLMMCKVDIHF